MNSDDKITSIKVIIITFHLSIISFLSPEKITQFTILNVESLTFRFRPNSPHFSFIQENDTRLKNIHLYNGSSSLFVHSRVQFSIRICDRNGRQRRRSTFISKLHAEERAEPRDRAGQKQGVAATALMRSCIVHAEATYFTRVCSQQDR